MSAKTRVFKTKWFSKPARRQLIGDDEHCLSDVAVLDAQAIKNLRENLNISQPVFARYLNTSVSTVQKWELALNA
jgi:putative transcriptional regulator